MEMILLCEPVIDSRQMFKFLEFFLIILQNRMLMFICCFSVFNLSLYQYCLVLIVL